MPNNFFSPEGDLEDYFITDYWIIDQYIGDTLWVWGRNDLAQLGINLKPNGRTTPVTTFAGGTNWKQISTGQSHTAAIKIDGTLWTWGRNHVGQIGINNSSSIGSETPVTTFSGGTNWKQVSSGNDYTAAIKTDGTLWVWGSNSKGELGINNIFSRSIPVTTFAGGINWKQVSCGGYHTAAIKTDGTLWIWGQNNIGQLGTNDATDKSTPVTTFAGGTNWKQVSCGGYHTAATKTDGTLWIWGLNVSGRLGINNTISKSTPVTTFAGGTNWKQVSTGYHTAAIKTDGTLWIWGLNDSGRLGINNTISRSTPVTTFAGGTDWKQVSCEVNHTAAIKTDGTLWTWGYGRFGRLGINNTISKSTPVTTFAGGTDWKQVSCGGDHTAAVKTGIELDIWTYSTTSNGNVLFNYPDFTSTSGLNLVSTDGVTSGNLYLTNTTGSNVGNLWLTNIDRYDKSFFLTWRFECSGGSGADGFTVQWHTDNSVNGTGGGPAGRVENSNCIHAITFKTFGTDSIIWYKNNVSQGTTNVTDETWRTDRYYWLDYDHAAQTCKIYYNTTNSKPGTASHTFTSFVFDTTSYYFGFGAGTGAATDNHIIKSMSMTT